MFLQDLALQRSRVTSRASPLDHQSLVTRNNQERTLLHGRVFHHQHILANQERVFHQDLRHSLVISPEHHHNLFIQINQAQAFLHDLDREHHRNLLIQINQEQAFLHDLDLNNRDILTSQARMFPNSLQLNRNIRINQGQVFRQDLVVPGNQVIRANRERVSHQGLTLHLSPATDLDRVCLQNRWVLQALQRSRDILVKEEPISNRNPVLHRNRHIQVVQEPMFHRGLVLLLSLVTLVNLDQVHQHNQDIRGIQVNPERIFHQDLDHQLNQVIQVNLVRVVHQGLVHQPNQVIQVNQDQVFHQGLSPHQSPAMDLQPELV